MMPHLFLIIQHKLRILSCAQIYSIANSTKSTITTSCLILDVNIFPDRVLVICFQDSCYMYLLSEESPNLQKIPI